LPQILTRQVKRIHKPRTPFATGIFFDRMSNIHTDEGEWKMRAFRTLLVLLGFLALAQMARAERVYVTDSFEITLRTGPTTDNKIIAMVPSGAALETLEEKDGWARVRRIGPETDVNTGWVLSRYLIKRRPWEDQAKELLSANQALRKRLAEAEETLKETVDRQKALREKFTQSDDTLTQIRKEYEDLKKGSADYLGLQKKYEALRLDFDRVVSARDSLTNELAGYKMSQRIRWFLAGGGVLFLGWVIGAWMGRLQKKRRGKFMYEF
jgi:SH3 domain protein